MEFLNMKFSNLFLEKHGKEIFNDICKQIKGEKPNSNENYIEIIFKIAFLNFFGMSDSQINKFLEDMEHTNYIDIKNTKKIHKESISKIQRYLNFYIK